MSEAPLYSDVEDAPAGGRAVWLTTADSVRIRVAVWTAPAAQGTVLLLPGRTEYIEKYGRAAIDLAARGYATVTVDWRGQGLADRALSDRMIGHIAQFTDFQTDLDAVMAFARADGLPEPYYLIAHSMGGCIGLRALMRGLPVKAAAFSAPMWGILMASWMRPVATALSTAARWFSFEGRYAPGTGPSTYVVDSPFVGNTLTTDAEMWDYMRRQALAHPELSLGGPSLGWLNTALAECQALSLLPSPDCPTLCVLGTAEKIVDVAPVHARMAIWPRGRLEFYAGSEHEVMMERPATRGRFFDEAAALFGQNR